jgi:hypothetical protein
MADGGTENSGFAIFIAAKKTVLSWAKEVIRPVSHALPGDAGVWLAVQALLQALPELPS